MGIGISQWRARIGSFCFPTAKEKFRPATMKIPFTMRPSIGLLLTLAVLLEIGGVETNPGPPKKQALLSQSGDIMDGMKKELGDMKKDMTWLRDQVDHLTKENKKLSMKIAQLDEQNRNKNLVFYGYEEEDNETWEDCENKIKQTIEEEFECTVDDRDIEKVFRVGKKRGDSDSEEEEKKPRPIICKFSSLKTRSKVLTNARAITRDKRSKNEPIPKVKVSEDYSPEVRETRRKLTSILIEKKEEAQRKNNKDFKCSLRHDKLVINSTVYKLDESGTLCKI